MGNVDHVISQWFHMGQAGCGDTLYGNLKFKKNHSGQMEFVERKGKLTEYPSSEKGNTFSLSTNASWPAEWFRHFMIHSWLCMWCQLIPSYEKYVLSPIYIRVLRWYGCVFFVSSDWHRIVDHGWGGNRGRVCGEKGSDMSTQCAVLWILCMIIIVHDVIILVKH